jgi:hypothetical protein
MDINRINITLVPLACSKGRMREREITIQCEQYGATVHLFIGTGHTPGKSTFMPLTFIYKHHANY